MKLLFVDTETGGLSPESHSILAIAALVVEDGQILDEYYSLIREDEVIIAEHSARKINGLRIEQVHQDGVSPLEAVVAITAMLNKHGMTSDVVIAAHNAPFDAGFMKRLWRLVGRDFGARFSYRLLCTHSASLFMHYAGLIAIPQGTGSLDALAQLLGVRLDREAGHNALNDARAGVAVLTCLTEIAHLGGFVKAPPSPPAWRWHDE